MGCLTEDAPSGATALLECVLFCAAFESDAPIGAPVSIFPEKPSAKSRSLSGYESGAEAPHSKTLARLPCRFRELS